MDEMKKDAIEAICRAIQELGNKIEDGTDDESTREYSNEGWCKSYKEERKRQ